MAMIDKSKTIFINNLRLLVNNFYNSLDFNNAVLALIRDNPNCTEQKIADVMFKLYEGRTVLGRKKIKDVYNRYQDYIKEIEYELGIYYYFDKVFDNGTLSDSYLTFYGYVYNNLRHIEQMKDLVEGIKQLGIIRVSLDDTLDYEEVRICNTTSSDSKNYFIFGQNPNVIASIGGNVVLYKLLDTNYLLPLEARKDEVKSTDESTIVVSNLLFDKGLLPKRIDEHNTMAKIIQSKTANAINISNTIKNPEVLSDALTDLDNQYKELESRISIKVQIDPEYEALVDRLRRLEATIEYLRYQGDIISQVGDEDTSIDNGISRVQNTKNVSTHK